MYSLQRIPTVWKSMSGDMKKLAITGSWVFIDLAWVLNTKNNAEARAAYIILLVGHMAMPFNRLEHVTEMLGRRSRFHISILPRLRRFVHAKREYKLGAIRIVSYTWLANTPPNRTEPAILEIICSYITCFRSDGTS